MKNILNISKEQLIDLYVNQQLTSRQIAKLFNSNRKSVMRLVKKYNIAINPKQRKFQIIKKIPFTDIQRDNLIGMILGDATISLHGRKDKSCRLQFGHCEKQEQLFFHQKDIFSSFINTHIKKNDKRGNSVFFSCVSVVHNNFNFFYKLFYQDGKKVIRDELIHYLTPIGLAQWLMDDGSAGKYSIRLHTEGFSKSENEKLAFMLKVKFDLICGVKEFDRNNKKYYYLSFKKKDSIKFSELVYPFIIESMKYKLVLPSTTLCQTSENEGDKV